MRDTVSAPSQPVGDSDESEVKRAKLETSSKSHIKVCLLNYKTFFYKIILATLSCVF